MIVRAAVTLVVTAASVLATVLLGGTPAGASLWLSWLVHIELTHLLSDAFPWLVLGCWLEPRSGSVRWAAWTFVGVVLTVMLHGVCYPQQSVVYGLSAAVYVVAFAGLVAWRAGVRNDPRRWVALAVLMLLVCDEVLRGQSAFRTFFGGGGRDVRFVELAHVSTTPLLHLVGAIVGSVLGLSLELGENRARRPAATMRVEAAPAALR